MAHSIHLTPTQPADLPALFQLQLNQEANHLAAFTAADSGDQATYLAKYTRFLADPTINTQTIWVAGEIVGSIAKFVLDGEAEITYWISREHWGQGVATAALREFLRLEQARPLRGRVAFDNVGSQRVLERCGFRRVGTDKGFARARQQEIEEYLYELPA